MTTRRTRLDLERQDGSVMLMTILVTIVIGMLVVALIATTDNSLNRTRQSSDRAVGLPVAETAITRYEFALQSGLVDGTDGYVLDRDDMVALLADDDELVIANDDLPFADLRTVDPSMPAEAQVTMRVAAGDSPTTHGYWQVYRVSPPSYALSTGAPTLAIYLRAWVGNESGAYATEPRMLRIEYRSGVFSDYHMLIDSELFFGDGSVIDGPIHSNGYKDGIPPEPFGSHRVWHAGRITCTDRALVTSAQGQVHLPPSCNFRQQDENFISFSTIDDAFNLMRENCTGVDGIVCYPGIAGSYRVHFSGNTVTINGTTTARDTTQLLVFEDDVEVSGTASGRTTVAAIQSDEVPVGGGRITVVGNVGAGGGASDVMGLFAESDVVVETRGCDVSRVAAAVISAHGALTVDPGLLSPNGVQVLRDGAQYCNHTFTLFGSIAGQFSPRLFWREGWEWSGNSGGGGNGRGGRGSGEPGDIGFAERRYEWDDRLLTNPPPFFPWTDRWEFSNWRNANSDCLTTRRSDPLCR